MRSWITILGAGALVATPAAANAAAFFTVNGGPADGTNIGGCASGSNAGGSPQSYESVCGSGAGSLRLASTSTFGSVGALALATTIGGGFTSVRSGGEALGYFRDTVMFSALGAGGPSEILVTLNYSLDGTLNASGGGFARAISDIELGSATVREILSSGGSGGDRAVGGIFAGPTFLAPVGVPVHFGLRMQVAASAGNNLVTPPVSQSSASADFSHTLSLPTSGAVFILPDGFSASAGDYLVNNRFVPAGAAGAVPEPAAWALLIAGFAMMGTAIRRRRRPATAFA